MVTTVRWQVDAVEAGDKKNTWEPGQTKSKTKTKKGGIKNLPSMWTRKSIGLTQPLDAEPLRAIAPYDDDRKIQTGERGGEVRAGQKWKSKAK